MNWRRFQRAFALTALLTLVAACGGTAVTTTPTTGTTGGASSGGATKTTETMVASTPAPAATTGGAAGGAATTAAATSGAAGGAATTAATKAATSAAATSSAGGGTTAATGGKVLHIADSVYPDALDPQKASFSNEIAILKLNYEGLTRFDKDLKTVPAAAESWQYSKDATAVTFTLRSGLKYSDGTPLVAQDFVNAVYRTLDPNSPGDYQTSINMIKGADAIINTVVPTETAKLPGLQKALGVKAVDDKTISFQFTQPTPFFHTLAGIWVMYPAKQSLVSKGGDTWWQDPKNQIGNGPFQVTKIDEQNNLIEFRRNDNYWGSKAKLDGVQVRYIKDLSVALQAYKSGEIDVMTPDPNDVPSIKADPTLGKEYKEYAGACTIDYEFNLDKPPFNNKKVREAFAYGFDRDTYIKDALKDTVIKTLTWIPPGYPGYDPSETRYNYDPAKAKQALADAGFPNGQGLPEIKFTYASSNPANQTRAERTVAIYQQSLGVTVGLDPIESKTLTSLRKKHETYPQFLRAGWCADYPDPQDWLSVYWNSSQAFASVMGYKNPDVDKQTNQGDSVVDPNARLAAYNQAQKAIIGDSAAIMLYNTKNTFLIKPYLSGFDFTPQDSDFPGTEGSFIGVDTTK